MTAAADRGELAQPVSFRRHRTGDQSPEWFWQELFLLTHSPNQIPLTPLDCGHLGPKYVSLFNSPLPRLLICLDNLLLQCLAQQRLNTRGQTQKPPWLDLRRTFYGEREARSSGPPREVTKCGPPEQCPADSLWNGLPHMTMLLLKITLSSWTHKTSTTPIREPKWKVLRQYATNIYAWHSAGICYLLARFSGDVGCSMSMKPESN